MFKQSKLAALGLIAASAILPMAPPASARLSSSAQESVAEIQSEIPFEELIARHYRRRVRRRHRVRYRSRPRRRHRVRYRRRPRRRYRHRGVYRRRTCYRGRYKTVCRYRTYRRQRY